MADKDKAKARPGGATLPARDLTTPDDRAGENPANAEETSYAKGQPDAAPLNPPKVNNDGVRNTATNPTQPMANVSVPDFLAHAVGIQSETGTAPEGLVDSPDPEQAKDVDLGSAYEKIGTGLFRATTDVWEKYTLPGAVTAQYRLIARKGSEVPEARVEALTAAVRAL